MNTETGKPETHNPPPGGRNSLPLTILAFGVTAVAIILALVFAYTRFWTVPKDAAADTARSITESIREAFNFTPKVTINNTVFIEESLPILELATVSRSSTVSYSYTNLWAGSTKILVLKGHFKAKGGFDLKQNATVNIRSNPLSIDAKFPPPKLLSVELVNYEIEASENGYWNRINPADQQEALKGMMNTAKVELGKTVREEAKKNLEEKLKDFARKQKADITFTYGNQK